jgi:predicted RNase H-like HicB family nuclease
MRKKQRNGVSGLHYATLCQKGHQRKGENMIPKPLFIRAEWDEEARVWVATSDDVAGLATEGPTLEELVEKLKIIIPELLDANQDELAGRGEVPFEILTRRFEIAQRPSC